MAEENEILSPAQIIARDNFGADPKRVRQDTNGNLFNIGSMLNTQFREEFGDKYQMRQPIKFYICGEGEESEKVAGNAFVHKEHGIVVVSQALFDQLSEGKPREEFLE